MMKKRIRICAAALALLMIVGLSGVPVHAEEYTAADTYVLNYNGVYEGPKWQYFSPYWPAFTLDGEADYTQSLAFTLYDTVNADAFAVYCTDLEVGLDTDSDFRRINLEDSTYAGAAAGKLRSVWLKGFPAVSAAELGAAAGVPGLTVGEAVAATQAAIWKTAHGDRAVFTDFADTVDCDWSSAHTAHFDACYAEIESGHASDANKAVIRENIEKVFHYLINLEPTAPTGAVASRRSFRSWDAELVENGDGSCDVVATATVDVALNEGDALTLTAMVGGYTAATALESGEKTYTLTIADVPSNVALGEITLAIDGVQSLGDVYLFDAVGERGASQSLIGYTEKALPVHAQVNANDRELIVYKTADGVGLQNISFDIYYVCSVDAYVNGGITLGTGIVEIDGVAYFSAPTKADIEKYVRGFPFATITTDENGAASFNFGNDSDGIYMVVERENAATTGAIHPFFVAIPGGSDPGDTGAYEIVVEPKNTVIREDVEIGKDVNEIGNDHDTCDVGQIHTWIIRASIPAGLATGLRYEITDTLNHQLTYVGNVKVSVSEKDAGVGEDLLVLREGEDYVLTVTEGTALVGETEEAITSFKVALTATGMAKVAAVEGELPELRICFDAFIDEDAVLGTEIPNQAHIRYENNVGIDFERDSDIPEVHTGGISLVKVDAANRSRRLSGAKFTLNIKNEDGTFTPVEFYTDAAMTQRAAEAVTDANGCALFWGLSYGTYYLIETEAPEGYNLLTEPVEVIIDGTTHLTENAVLVTNSAQFRLPETGGIGTAVFTFGGAGILGAAALVLLGGKKKRG